ncbi:MAG: aspartate 1-decarboxylase [Planctomycetota bacterium]
MQRKVMLSKIHRATVTRCDVDYVGSITIDAELLHATGIRPNEAVWVLDIDNAVRFETYVIAGEPGSGAIEINGAAAKLVEVGHKVIILNYGLLEAEEIDDHVADVVICDDANAVGERRRYPSSLVDSAPILA